MSPASTLSSTPSKPRPPATSPAAAAIRLEPGLLVQGKVERVERFGVFVRLGPGLTGLVPNKEMGTSPGTVIRNNHIHHVFHAERWPGAGEGIILDNGCCGILVENNLVHDAVAGGFRVGSTI